MRILWNRELQLNAVESLEQSDHLFDASLSESRASLFRVAITFHPPGSHWTLDADTGRFEHSLSASERVRTLAQRGATA
jgi:hypothetical protein